MTIYVCIYKELIERMPKITKSLSNSLKVSGICNIFIDSLNCISCNEYKELKN